MSSTSRPACVGWPVANGLEADFPGIKRHLPENYVRYTFVRYGVPYVVAIECHDGGAAFRQDVLPRRRQGRGALSQVAALAGGTPQTQPDPLAADTIERPTASLDASSPTIAPGRPPARHRLQAQERRRRLHRLFQDSLPDRGGARFRQLPVLHELGRLRSDRTGRNGAMRGRAAAYRCRVNGQTTLISR